MTAQALTTPKFLRKTRLSGSEYNTNFHMMDQDIVEAISSPEADKITQTMSKIYLRLWQTPKEYRECEGVLRFTGETREGKWIKAWDQLCRHLRVSSETANKALSWMHEQGIIGYSAFKNGVGIRIFLNRAASSIATRSTSTGKKILPISPASKIVRHASTNETAFNDSYAVKDDLDNSFNSDAPQNGADTKTFGEIPPDTALTVAGQPQVSTWPKVRKIETVEPHSGIASANEIIERLRIELEPCLKSAAMQAATQAAAREVARTREWFETKALPKAVRVAQHETYDLLKKQGMLDERERRVRADLQVGRASSECTPPPARPLMPEEITETAQMCLALLEVQGKSIDVTLSELGSEAGGWLLPEDITQVREEAHRLLQSRAERR